MSDTMGIEAAIKFVAETFAQELQKLRDMRPGRNYQPDVIALRVEVGQTGGMSLSYSQGYGTDVKTAHFGTLMDEVYRRAGFENKEAGRIKAASDTLLAISHEEAKR